MVDSKRPVLRVLALHTGGVLSLDARGTLGSPAGPLLRWLAGSATLALGPELEQLLDGLGAGRLPDGREISAWWLHGEGQGPAPTGRSADLAIAMAVLLRRARAELAVDLPRPGEDHGGRAIWWITGSAALAQVDGEDGGLRFEPVTGWDDKLRHLAESLAGTSVDRVFVLHAATQQFVVSQALQRHFVADANGLSTSAGARVEPVAVASPDQLPDTLQRLFGRQDAVNRRWRSTFSEAAPAAAALLGRAETLAQQEGYGHLGVDHVMRTLLVTNDRGPVLSRLRRLLPERELCDMLVRSNATPVTLVPTPRLTRVARQLAAGFDVMDLLQAIVRDQTSPFHVVAGLDLNLALPMGAHTDPGRTRESWNLGGDLPATWLEVLRGPEDGRALRPQPGDVIGRAGGPATLQLGVDSESYDRGLSRAHVIWHGDGQIVPLKACRYIAAFAPRNAAEGEPIALQDGQVLQLTPFTWLRGRAGEV